MKALLGGEGVTELGDWARHPSYRTTPPRAGCLEQFLRAAVPRAEVIEGVQWKDIRKFRAGAHRAAERRAVLGLALRADEWGCALLVFVRDRDGLAQRTTEIDGGIAEARSMFSRLAIVGATPVEAIESWILSLVGVLKAESLSDPKSRLAQHSGAESAAAKAEIVRQANLEALPPDAASLHEWLSALRAL